MAKREEEKPEVKETGKLYKLLKPGKSLVIGGKVFKRLPILTKEAFVPVEIAATCSERHFEAEAVGMPDFKAKK